MIFQSIHLKQPLSVLFFGLICFSSCATIKEQGKASYYSDEFDGRQTANGSIFHQNKRTAASKTLPFGTKVKVINLDNRKTVHVRITDRGPFVAGRIIDLSKKAAKKLGMLRQGIANVEIKYHNR